MNNVDLDKEVRIKLVESLQEYRKTMQYMVCDVPISVLDISKSDINLLERNGFVRLYDLIGADLTKIEGLRVSTIDRLTSGLQQFISMS